MVMKLRIGNYISEDSFRVASHIFLDGVPFLSHLAGAVDVGLQYEEIQLFL